MKTHQSKIDKIYWVILLFFVVMAVYGIIIQEWLMAIICTISSAYFCLIFFTMRYVIDDEYLLIRTKFFPSQKVTLQDIRKIEESNSILAAPAFSLIDWRFYIINMTAFLYLQKIKNNSSLIY